MKPSDLIAIPELVLLITAYFVTTQRDVPNVIKAYSWQSYILGGTGLIIAITQLLENQTNIADSFIPIFLIALLPFALGVYIEQVLARATVPQSETKLAFIRRVYVFIKQVLSRRLVSDEEKRLADSIWLKQRHTISPRAGIVLALLTALAFAIVFLSDLPVKPEPKIGISVSLALHLIGLYNTFLRRDILSQVIGILTMDQGMYLAILKVVNIPAPAFLFVIALYFYTIITLIILFLVLPQFRRQVDTLSLDEITQKSELEG